MAKPTTAQGYDPETTAHARATCLYVATKLGDLVLVGGLVPSPLIGGSGADDDRVAGATSARRMWISASRSSCSARDCTPR